MKSLIGQVVNYRYEILEKTAEGSFFTVYRTRDKVMNRLVAVKVLRPEFSEDSGFVQRLIAQQQRLIPISHPNLVKAHEAESAADAVYIAEEHVRGIDLKERIKRIAPFTVSSAVDVSIAVCQALDYLHRSGIVHGNLRPQDVLMGPEGEIKLTGAGVMLAFGDQEEKRTIALMKSAPYLAPELFQGARPDERTDIYSLGVIIYEMLTATQPYVGESPIAIAVKHARDPIPSARAINAGVPRAIEGIIIKAMAKEPGDRYATAREMLADLRNVQDSLRVGRPLTWSPQDPKPQPQQQPQPQEEIVTAVQAPEREESLLQGVFKAALLVVFVAAVVFGGFLLLVGQTKPDVTVPDLIGVQERDAQNTLEQNELKMEVARREYNERYEEGEIYFTSPQAGQSVKPGSSVQVYVSNGSRYVVTPGVVGMTEGDANAALKNAGFVVGATTNEYSSTIPSGKVVKQTPKAGTKVDRGRAMANIVVSLGPDPATIAPPEDVSTGDDDSAVGNSTGGETRKLRVRFSLPEDGPSHRVQIVVKDFTGEFTAYEKTHQPGDKISVTVNAVGENVEIITFFDGKEVDRQVK